MQLYLGWNVSACQNVLANAHVPIEVLQEVEDSPGPEQHGNGVVLLVGRKVEIYHLQGGVDEDQSERRWQMSTLLPRQSQAESGRQVAARAVSTQHHPGRVHPKLSLCHGKEVQGGGLAVVQVGWEPVLWSKAVAVRSKKKKERNSGLSALP